MGRVHLIVHPQKRPFKGSVPVPTDNHMAQASLLLAALSNGACTLRCFSPTLELMPLLRALRALGVRYTDDERGTLTVYGVGLQGLQAPSEPIDCGDSLATVALLLGVCSGLPFTTWLVGGSLASRLPMSGFVKPLRERGAVIIGESHAGSGQEVFLPLEVGPLTGGERLRPIEHRMQKLDPWTKNALLLSGLYASGPTWVHEPFVSQDALERLLVSLNMPVESIGSMISLHPPADPQAISAFEYELVGDVSLAAYLLALGAILEGSAVDTRRTSLNPSRGGVLDLFRAFGARIGITPKGDVRGEPFGEVSVRGAPLHGVSVTGELALRCLTELPAGCILAARASGLSVFSELSSVRERDPELPEALLRVLQGFGLSAEIAGEELRVEGRPLEALERAEVDCGGDARVAMLATILGLLAKEPCIVDDVECLSLKFPRFVGTLRALGAQIEVKR